MSRKAWLAAISQGSLLLALSSCSQLLLATVSGSGLASYNTVTGSNYLVPNSSGTLGTGTTSGTTSNAGVSSTGSSGTSTNSSSPSPIMPAYTGGGLGSGVAPATNGNGLGNYLVPNGSTGMGM